MNELTLNGQKVCFTQGETLLDITSRQGLKIPTLCHDPRLDPAGACRSCLVEVTGERLMTPACARVAQAGMEVTTENERVDRYRQTLMALYMTDHPHERETSEVGSPDLLLDMAAQFDAPMDWGWMNPVREGREDRNPYVDFNPDTITNLTKLRIPCLYGDIDDVELLHELPLDKMKLAVSTIPDFEINSLLIETIKTINPDAIIIVRAHHLRNALELYKKGANYVLTPHFLGGEYVGKMIKDLKLDDEGYKTEKRKHVKMLGDRIKLRHEHPSIEKN